MKVKRFQFLYPPYYMISILIGNALLELVPASSYLIGAISNWMKTVLCLHPFKLQKEPNCPVSDFDDVTLGSPAVSK